MKNNIKTLLEAAISDNKSYIKSFTENGNIREYFESDYGNHGPSWYLTEEEIELWENSESERERLNNEILDLLYQYNVPIDTYLNENVTPAY
jgi:phosphoribosyl-ATP pyrophosphohydrolase